MPWRPASIIRRRRNGAGNGNDPILLQRTGSGGGGAGNPVTVDPTTAESQRAADMAVLSNGNLVVVWRSFNFTTFTSALLLRVFDQAGTGISVETPFATEPNPAFPTVAGLKGWVLSTLRVNSMRLALPRGSASGRDPSLWQRQLHSGRVVAR